MKRSHYDNLLVGVFRFQKRKHFVKSSAKSIAGVDKIACFTPFRRSRIAGFVAVKNHAVESFGEKLAYRNAAVKVVGPRENDDAIGVGNFSRRLFRFVINGCVLRSVDSEAVRNYTQPVFEIIEVAFSRSYSESDRIAQKAEFYSAIYSYIVFYTSPPATPFGEYGRLYNRSVV